LRSFSTISPALSISLSLVWMLRRSLRASTRYRLIVSHTSFSKPDPIAPATVASEQISHVTVA